MKAQGNKGIAPIECTNPRIRKYVFRFNFQEIDENIVEFDYIEITGHEPTRNEKIHAEIRARYEDNDEWQLNRQMNEANDPDSEMTEEERAEARRQFYEFNNFVKELHIKYPKEND